MNIDVDSAIESQLRDQGKHRLAVMRNIGYGCRDVGRPVLWFEAYITESSAALTILEGKDADQLIKDSGCYDIHNLEGKTCWVDVSDQGYIKFIRYANIGN